MSCMTRQKNTLENTAINFMWTVDRRGFRIILRFAQAFQWRGISRCWKWYSRMRSWRFGADILRTDSASRTFPCVSISTVHCNLNFAFYQTAPNFLGAVFFGEKSNLLSIFADCENCTNIVFLLQCSHPTKKTSKILWFRKPGRDNPLRRDLALSSAGIECMRSDWFARHCVIFIPNMRHAERESKQKERREVEIWFCRNYWRKCGRKTSK